jgi:hypothetical protein
MNLRSFVMATATAVFLLPRIAYAIEPMTVYKSASCGCCIGWIKHLEANGFQVTGKDLPNAALMQKKLAAGLRPELSSCHTGQIAGYIIEGHVPAREVRKLLADRPDAVGLTVPDMPLGSPGMEAGDDKEPYDVLLLKKDGSTEVYASYR